MADIELMTTRHFDNIINLIEKNNILSKFKTKNIRRASGSRPVKIEGPVVILATNAYASPTIYFPDTNIEINADKINNFPFIICEKGFEIKHSSNSTVDIYYILI